MVGWWRYYQVEPWGEQRDDERFEALRNRLLATEETIDKHIANWPYYSEEFIRACTETDDEKIARMKRQGLEILARKGMLKHG